MEAVLTPVGFMVVTMAFIAALAALSRPIFGLVLLPISAVAIDYASHKLFLMAAANTVILLILLLGLVREKSLRLPGTSLRPRSGADAPFVWLAALTFIYLGVAIARGNPARYVTGDFFHLFFEMCLPFFLFMIYARTPERFQKFFNTLGLWVFLFSGLVLLLYVTGLFQKLPGAGVWYRDMGILRIRYTHHYPLLPMTLLLGFWLFQKPSVSRRQTGVALLMMLVMLLLGLKRTLWIALLLVLVFYFVMIGPRRQLQVVRNIFVGVAVIMVIAMLLVPGELFQEISRLDPYSEVVQSRFSSRESDITVSVMNREVQLRDALGYVARNPLGYGIGSEFDLVFSARKNVPLATHYVHSGYVQYLLQLGVWWILFLLVLSFRVFRTGVGLFRRLPDGEMKGAVLGAMGCYMAILITSITEISVNTFFLPISAAIIFQAENLSRQEGLLEPRRGNAASSRDRQVLLVDLPRGSKENP